MNALLTPLVKPLALAVSCLLPTESMRRFVNETVPLPALVPMSRLVVPSIEPDPLDRLALTFRLAGKPTVESLPKVS